MNRRTLPALSLVAVAGLALAGCAASGDDAGAAEGGSVSVVASTSVYADLASSVFGDAADVTAIVDSPSVDPHEYEATAQDQLAVTEADLAIFNGGGYDAYMEQLVEAGEVEHSVMAVEYNHDYPDAEVDGHEHSDEEADADDHAEGEAEHDHAEDEGDGHTEAEHADETEHDHAEGEDGHNHVEGFNEHVWYDPHTMIHVVEAIADEASELIPDEADAFAQNAADLTERLEGLEAGLADIEADHAGATVAFTEPVGGYLTTAAGLEDVTAEGFAEAVEHGQEVAPATLLEATTALEGGEVDVFVVNPQTAGPETDAVVEAAETGGVPIVEFTETIPDGDDYVTWMQANVDALAAALGE
ncbi:metal ABC transporter solute-binding protein, Zn/Mn family [Microbacterium halophytorum]|uniref:metal ABC transporter solute-binding protein, Zn/Mn family n=1 Tax=Microbacterium halophytorum TaxID=2067568 RepID=UPI000CFB2EF7|nr:zinc ABC transporter substrate-binding protein [Microbacterium halophytorum]